MPKDPNVGDQILTALRENNLLLRHLFRALASHRVLGGVMSKVGDPLQLITPGSTPKFTVTASPADVLTVAEQTTWTSSDPTNAPVTMDASDPTGLTATVDVSESATVGSEITLTWTYANADGSKAVAEGIYPVVAPPAPPVPDVTGGTMEQSE